MKKFMMVVLLGVILTLSGCSLLGNPNFIEIEGFEIEGYQVYEYYDEKDVPLCSPQPWTVAARDDEDTLVTRYGFKDCTKSFFVLRSNTFVTLTEAVEVGLFTLDDVIEDRGDILIFETYSLSIYDVSYFKLFRNDQDVEIYDDVTDISRIIASSTNSIQLFAIGEPKNLGVSSLDMLGYIEVYDDEDTLLTTFEVYEGYIYDKTNQGFQSGSQSELYYEFSFGQN